MLPFVTYPKVALLIKFVVLEGARSFTCALNVCMCTGTQVGKDTNLL